MAKNNSNLHKAKKEKNDEFYTRYEDIEKELSHYGEHLKGKWVYSPCDDYRFSQFKNYFVQNFSSLGLSHYTCTNYDLDYEVVGFGGNTLSKEVFNEYLQQGHKTHYGHNLLIYKKDGKWVIPYNRILVKKRTILNNEKM